MWQKSNKRGGPQVKNEKETMPGIEKIAPVHEAGHFMMQVIAYGIPRYFHPWPAIHSEGPGTDG